MAALTNAGLISRSNGRHFLTSVGKVVYKAQLLIGKAKQNFWKLKAIDSIEASYQGSTMEEWKKVIDNLIQDDDLKEILLESNKTKRRTITNITMMSSWRWRPNHSPGPANIRKMQCDKVSRRSSDERP